MKTTGLEALEFLVGTWKTQGEVMADGQTPAIAFKGTDSYQWILNRKFVLHKVDVVMGQDKVEAFELIGLDAKSNKFTMRSFDHQGTFTEMEAYIDEKGVLHIAGPNMRSQLMKHDDRLLTAYWERQAENTAWVPWMNLQLSRIA